jgi:uncharacterized protein (DUF2236 family)
VALGPDSLTWKYSGDWRGLLMALWAGSMQNMHPGLGAAVEQHSQFFDERWERIFRSLYPIHGLAYDGERAAATAAEVRGYHTGIKGVDDQGRRYHALDPGTFFWAHSTFFMATLLLADRFMGGLADTDRARLYDEYVQMYRQYGLSMRPVPATWADFQTYWAHMCTDVLEDNRATRDVLDLSELPKPVAMPWLPDALWRLLREPVARHLTWVTVGLYPPAVRELLGYDWTTHDERWFRRFGTAVDGAFALVPRRLRYHPRARAGWRRALGADAADAPLVHTPDRNLPPLDERGDPRHYVPLAHRPIPAATEEARTPETASGR